MGWAHLERLVDSAVALYLVIHGVVVPREGRRDLLVGWCQATRASLGSWVRRVSSVGHMLR
jgi:hypothetical protein